jgi:hypothetical protein
MRPMTSLRGYWFDVQFGPYIKRGALGVGVYTERAYDRYFEKRGSG